MASHVLADPDGDRFHITLPDKDLDRLEDRWITMGSHPYNRAMVLYIVWTERADELGPITRIISARRATRQERSAYAKETF